MRLKLSNEIKAEALRLGFFACGIARAEPVADEVAAHVRRWLDVGGNAGMTYMGNYIDKRLDPRLLMDGVKSIVCVALNYAPAQHIPSGELQLASYAYGADYHDVVKEKLHQLAAHFGLQPLVMQESVKHPAINDISQEDRPHYRAFCDSAPILERYWAERAGLGWTGRNHQLIIPKAGSMFVLGELFIDIELVYDTPIPNRCGTCYKCIDACPTRALGSHSDISAGVPALFDAEKCLSYQTIENRGPLSSAVSTAMGNTIYGCDCCQSACPWNRNAPPTTVPELQPKPELLAMTRDKWRQLTEEEYRKLFKGSAVKRAKYTGLMRNINAVTENYSKDSLNKE